MKIVLSLLAASLLAASLSAQAAVTITIQEVGDDVVVIGSGYLNSDLLSGEVPTLNEQEDVLNPSESQIQAGSTAVSMTTRVTQLPEPPVFGIGSETLQPTSNTGDPFGLSVPFAFALGVTLPSNYINRSQLEFSMTFANASLSTLGINLGTYEWLWGDRSDDSRVILNVIPREVIPPSVTTTPVPALGAFGLLGLASAIGAAGVAMKRRRKQ